METKIQFIKGFDEKVLPDVRLTRSRDGSTGTATFRFKNPNILDKNTDFYKIFITNPQLEIKGKILWLCLEQLLQIK